MHVKDLQTLLGHWALVVFLGQHKHSQCVHKPRSTFSPFCVCYLHTLRHAQARGHLKLSSQSKISVYPKWTGASQSFSYLKMLFCSHLKGKRNDHMTEMGNDWAPFFCCVTSVKCRITVLCVLCWGETEVKSVIWASVNTCTMGW